VTTIECHPTMEKISSKFTSFTHDQVMSVRQSLFNWLTEFNFYAPLFLTDFIFQRLNDNFSGDKLVKELELYLSDNAVFVVDWINSLIDDANSGNELVAPELVDEESPPNVNSDMQLIQAIVDEKAKYENEKEPIKRKSESERTNRRRIKKLATATFHSPIRTCRGYAVALKGYKPASYGFLDFEAGDLFNVLYNAPDMNGWVAALNFANKEGLVPGNYIKYVSLDESIQLGKAKIPNPCFVVIQSGSQEESAKLEGEVTKTKSKKKKVPWHAENPEPKPSTTILHDYLMGQSKPGSVSSQDARASAAAEGQDEATPVPSAPLSSFVSHMLVQPTSEPPKPIYKVSLRYVEAATNQECSRPLLVTVCKHHDTIEAFCEELRGQVLSTRGENATRATMFKFYDPEFEEWVKVPDLKLLPSTKNEEGSFVVKAKMT